jgi:hypothetical protein
MFGFGKKKVEVEVEVEKKEPKKYTFCLETCSDQEYRDYVWLSLHGPKNSCIVIPAPEVISYSQVIGMLAGRSIKFSRTDRSDITLVNNARGVYDAEEFEIKATVTIPLNDGEVKLSVFNTEYEKVINELQEKYYDVLRHNKEIHLSTQNARHRQVVNVDWAMIGDEITVTLSINGCYNKAYHIMKGEE